MFDFALVVVAFGIVSLNGINMAILDVNNFFNVNGNLTKVTWAHAVNNRTLLTNALNSNVMMLEADVVVGNLTGSNQVGIPIMAHPPAQTSDLSLQAFLTSVQAHNVTANRTRKGVKLDFKTIEALESSLLILTYMVPQLPCPVWINADILPGPQNAQTQPVNSTRFFTLAATLANTTLSIGWTTSYGQGINATYTNAHVTNMVNALSSSNVTHPVTFPVRAGIAAESIPQMQTLVNNVSLSTITIWSSEGDPVNVTNLRTLIKTVGISRTYIDLPATLENQLNLDSSASGIFVSFAALLALLLLVGFV